MRPRGRQKGCPCEVLRSGRDAGRRRLSSYDQPATRAAGVLGYEPLDRQAPEPFGQPFGQTEVQLADHIGIEAGDLGERTAAEHVVDPAASLGSGRTKAPAGRLLLQQPPAGPVPSPSHLAILADLSPASLPERPYPV